jgi:hypothetical protein
VKRLAGLILVAAVVLAPGSANARHRAHVVIHKRPPAVATYPAAPPLVVVPPFAVAFDLVRRTSCDPAVAVATGPNDPGFTAYPVGNYLVPAINRGACSAKPK